MGILDDSVIFTAVIQRGGFSRAAHYLGISSGLVSRRIAHLETSLGVSLIKRTTRDFQLTTEGELFFQHAIRIQQELDSALNLIHASAKKPTGVIRISAPPYFGRHYLIPVIMNFMRDFPDIKIDLILSNKQLDSIKERLDLIIRGAGFVSEPRLQDSNLQMRLLLKEKIGLYASPAYLLQHGALRSGTDLSNHVLLNYSFHHRNQEDQTWSYLADDGAHNFKFESKLNTNDIESCIHACIAGLGIGRFTELNARIALQAEQICPVLEQYDWGIYHLFAIYPQQHALPERTRLFLEFVFTKMQTLSSKTKLHSKPALSVHPQPL
ncbi:MAG: LysR family transcriptional regulator [Legionella sp.]|nr:LysR family transcriptional regulator [Legionella sp.]